MTRTLMVHKQSFLGSTVAAYFGLFLIVSSTWPGGSRHYLYAGIEVLFGALAYKARKKQKFGGPKKWLVLEVVSWFMVGMVLSMGIWLGRGWLWNSSHYPWTFLFIPA